MFSSPMEWEESVWLSASASQEAEAGGDGRLAAAKAAAELGIPVVALHPGSKKSFLGWSSGTTDMAVLDHWFFNGYPGCNFGLVMGNGWVCVDLDSHQDGQNGTKEFEQRFGSLPETFWVKTPRGQHHYFRTPGRSVETSFRHSDVIGLDIIGAKQYVVAPYSVLSHGETYKPFGDINSVAQLPDSLAATLTDGIPDEFVAEMRPTTNETVSNTATKSEGTSRLSAGERANILRYLDRINPSLAYNDWFRTIFAALNVWGAQGETIELLRTWSRNSSKWDEKEFNSKIRSYRSDHSQRLGIPFLTEAVAQWPMQRTVPAIRVEGITEQQLDELVAHQWSLTSSLLVARACPPSEAQSRALRVIADSLIRGLYSSDMFRTAFPLETGMGKTTSIIALCSTIVSQELPKALLITCERIEQLAEIRSDLVSAGVPLSEIGVLHSVTKYKRELPSISLSDAPNYRFLLASHHRPKLTSNRRSLATQLTEYKQHRRDLTIWDESLIGSRGHSMSVDILIDSINVWQGRYELKLAEGGNARPTFAPIYPQLEAFFRHARSVLFETKEGLIELPTPDIGENEFAQGIRNILEDGMFQNELYIECLTRLSEYSQRGAIRLHRVQGRTLLQYEDLIAEEFARIFILDASAPIRHLALYDDKLAVHHLPITKDYRHVNVDWIAARSSKSSFDDKSLGDHYGSFMSQLKAMMESNANEEGIILCHKERKAQIQEDLVLIRQKLRWSDSIPIHVLNWGEHRASNKYRNSKWTFLFGLQYLPKDTIAAMILGQTGRLDYTFLDGEIDDILKSELAESIFQAICRGNSRNVANGVAGAQKICLTIPKKDSSDVLRLLGRVMPGAMFTQIESPYLKEHARKNAISHVEIAETIAEYLKGLAASATRISKRSVNKSIGIKANSVTARRADEYLRHVLIGWRQDARSYVRLESPK